MRDELRILRTGANTAAEAAVNAHPFTGSPAFAETVVKNSRFVALLLPLVSLQDVRPRVERIREDHPGAAHVVHAAVVGNTRNSLQFSASDDGEPKGTSGRPALEVLRGSGLTNVLLAVVRYFGGTRLGTGGLVRAYSDAARAVLAVAPTKPLIETRTVWLEAGYDVYDAARRLIDAAGATVRNEEFDTTVQLELTIAAASLDSLLEALRDVSRGAVRIKSDEDAS